MDPRVKTAVKDLTTQHDLSLMCYNNIQKCMEALKGINADDTKLAEVRKNFNTYSRTFSSIQNILQDSDMPPTTQTIKAAKDAEIGFAIVWAKWKPSN